MSSGSESSPDGSVFVDVEDVQDFNTGNSLPLSVEEVARIKEWLQPTPYGLERSEYCRHRASYLAGTGQWLTSTTVYRQWHQGADNGILWIKGIPGSGKSVMAASIIDQLQKEEVPVLYFFFRQIIDANHQPKAALQDWLCQVLNYSPRLQMKLNDYIEENRALDTLSLSDLWKDLKLALASFPKAYCVTDALDEMDQGNDQFLHDLVELGQSRPSNIKVLITSRPVAAVENCLRATSIAHIRLEEHLVDNDIAAYVQYKLGRSSVPPECWGTIKNAVPGRANGLFLYAKLSMNAFLEPGADPTEVLRALPADLNVMYNDLLREHAKRSGVPDDFQRFIMQFVTHATRPLRLLEIAEISEVVHATDESGSLKATKDLVRAACGPLLEILPDETVSVAHHSFTEFLKGLTRSSDCDDDYPVLLAGPTNKRLAVACLDYLTCLDHSGIKERFDKNVNYCLEHAEGTQLRLQFPFLDYAVENWHIHARRAEQAGIDVFSVYELLDTIFAHQQRFIALVAMMWPDAGINCITPLHVSAGTGLAGYVGYLLQRESETEMYDSNRQTPLCWAAMSGHGDTVQVLLANGAKPNVQGISGLKPLHYAARKNHAEVVKLLLSAGVDPMTPTHENRRPDVYTLRVWHTPLMYACHAGHVEAVSAFLPFLNDIQTCQQALYWAAVRGQAAVVDLVLQHSGVDVNAKFRGDTALFKACEAGDQKSIDILLRAGADPNLFCAKAKDEFTGKGSHRSTRYFGRREGGVLGGFTPLHSLCGTFRESPICSNGLQLLLDAGADIHLKDPEGSTPLHYACRANQINLVKTLLEAGADPTGENDAGETPLHTDGAEDKRLLPVLLKSGLVNINKQLRKTGKTPLMCRLERNKSPLAFLQYKPDVNAMNAEGTTGLHIALERRRHPVEDYREIVVALLSCGANPNLKNRVGDTPLHTMCEDAYELLPILLQAGADFEARDRAGRTVLFRHIDSIQISRSNPTLFQTLIDLGVRLDTHDFKGRTLLHQCCHQISRLDHMISLGLDPTLTDYEGNTLLIEIAASKISNISKLAFLKHLCGLGLAIDQANHRGNTVLHTLCARVETPNEHLRSLDYVLDICNNPNPCDVDGVQPLHLAATISEVYVYKLLNSGADIFGVTHEGMSALHTAARARLPNIVGLLCSRLLEVGDDMRRAFINQQNAEGQTALHLACRSGRPETVQILLEAGAEVHLMDETELNRSLFKECAQFEAEQTLWDHIQNTYSYNAAGVLLNDTKRPCSDQDGALSTGGGSPRPHRSHWSHTVHDSTRLDAILEFLVLQDPIPLAKCRSFSFAFYEAVSNHHEYTVDCFSRLWTRMCPDILFNHSNRLEYLTSKYRLEATQQALREYSNSDDADHPSKSIEFLEELLFRRQYEILEESIAKQGDPFRINRDAHSLLHSLVKWGFNDILARVCPRDAVLDLDDHEWCRMAEAKASCSQSSLIRSLLVTACLSELPNMSVLTFLVEEIGVNLDIKCRSPSRGIQELIFVPSGGPLHQVAAGGSWWHVAKALPYLIKMGANVELRDDDGATPLQTALSGSHYSGPFHKDAAKLLIECGADVNAVDAKGMTCLAKAGNDLTLLKLLLANGATVTASDIFSAIGLEQVEKLEVLLAQGDYANLRKPGPGRICKSRSRGVRIVDSEVSPLLHVLGYGTPTMYQPEDVSRGTRMVKTLLNHGADLYAYFSKDVRVMKEGYDEHSDMDESEELDVWEPQTTTVIHEFLRTGLLIEPLFHLPFLDLELRDSSGETLLLAACRSYETLNTEIHCAQGQETVTKTVLQELIDRGADVAARDKYGKNIFHHIGLYYPGNDFAETCMAIIEKNPNLIHQPNLAGDTFFHEILRQHAFQYMDLFWELGANPLQPDSYGNTALHYLADELSPDPERKSHFDLFRKFLAAGVDINAKNRKGETPLFRYILQNSDHWVFPSDEEPSRPCFDFFQETGADFFARNNAGSTLLHLVASVRSRSKFNEKEAVEYEVQSFKILISMGLDPMAEDMQQRTSLDVAAACGSEHILKLFERKPME